VPSVSDPRSDVALLTAHVAGDRQAFGALFARHWTRLYRLALARSTTAEDAEDAVQEAMIGALRAAGNFRHDAAVSSWLHRIVINACADRFRRNASRPAICSLDDFRAVSDHQLQVDTALVLGQALLQLPPTQRAAILAVDLHGYTIAEAARILGVAEGTVKSRRARARLSLARMLRAHGSP